MSNNSPFTEKELKKDLNFLRENDIQVLLVEPDTEKGFEFPYMLYLPKNPKSTLIMDCLNDYEIPMANTISENLSAIEDVYGLFNDMRIKSEHLPSTTGKTEESKDISLSRLYYRLGKGLNTIGNLVANRFQDAPIMVPLIPGYTDKAGMSELGVDIAKEFVPQVVAMIQDAKTLVSQRSNVQLNNKIMTYGHSKSSTFADHFTALHPELVQTMMLTGTEDFTLPISEIVLQIVDNSEKSENEQFQVINGKTTKKNNKNRINKHNKRI